jgi:hypothetical protein
MMRLLIESTPPVEALANEKEVEGKFVQFHWQGNEYLLFATRDHYRFHNQMLAGFFTAHGLPYHWRDETTLEFELPEFSVIGGGRFRLSREPQQLELWDNSQAYGRFDETGLAERLKASGHPFATGTITIR